MPFLPRLPDLSNLPELPEIKLPPLPFHLTKCQQRIALGVAACAALAVAVRALPRKPPRRVIPSPRAFVDDLSLQERAELPYPPNALPGGRDVETPYGTIRVFEWGPEAGERVMLVHGISTPCIFLGDLAWELARKGFRVILFGKCCSGTFPSFLGSIRVQCVEVVPFQNAHWFESMTRAILCSRAYTYKSTSRVKA